MIKGCYMAKISKGIIEADIHMVMEIGSKDAEAWSDFVRNRSSGHWELAFENDQLIIRPVEGGEPIPESQIRLEVFE